MNIEKKKISAKIVADSVDNRGNRITTFILTYPRFIHSELLTHRLFSRNAASSRAIPFNKMVKDIEDDPFIPIAWQKDHKGMQGTEYFTENDLACDDPDIKDSVPFHLTQVWLKAMEQAINLATYANSNGLTKQLCNRLLEPFQWYTCLVTATEYDNFYELRCPKLYHAADGNYYKSVKDWNNVDKDIQYEGLACLHPENHSQAEIHIQALAEAMRDSRNESIPKKLKAGEWHIPFGDRMNISSEDSDSLWQAFKDNRKSGEYEYETIPTEVLVATARCARLSYMTFDGEIDYDKDIKLHDTLLESKHFSPFEHCCKCMSDEEYEFFYKGRLSERTITTSGTGRWSSDEDWIVYDKDDSYGEGWCNNVKGFIPYRYMLENEQL